MNKNAIILTLALAGATSLAAMLTPVAAMAVTYNVNRSWSDQDANNASLVGTVDVPVGSYTIENGTPNPFTNVNLTMKVNGASYPVLNAADTSKIQGTGQFFVNATSSVLTFNTANANWPNLAYLTFKNSSTGLSGQTYSIGSGYFPPGDESTIGTSPNVIAPVFFGDPTPVTFGTAQQQPTTSVPEPSATLGLLGLGWLGVGSALKRMRKSSKSSRVR